MSDSCGNRSSLKWPKRLRAIFSAETVGSLIGSKGVVGVEAETPAVTGEGGEGENRALRLVESQLIRC